ncbi:alpha/beta hydrolase [Amycolatopsis sp. RTGN1]|uniref:alpha/beta hydrolase n=1 Tax=Amycolatopsis ponsaeliensis TaxID=2992142 RepID=UPI00254E88D7|nr:alpha/beta hydrolase [Amycolatopsis sp. RTGN1]
MKLNRVDPELRSTVARIPSLPIGRKWGRRVVRALVRRRGPGKPIDGVDVRTLNQGQGLRLYTPAGGGSGAALLWMHGGGYIIGDICQDDTFCSATAHELGIVVVSAEYRLAPEHPFPAALDDAFAAWQWLQQSAGSLGVSADRIAVGGSSAGAGLAACLAQRIHDAGGTQPAGQWLFSPMLDDRTAARHELDQLRHRVWSNSANRIGWGAYLGVDVSGPRRPDYSVAARRADLRGLPPTWISVGDIDLFADECREYAERMRTAGVDCSLDLVPGAPHGFEAWAPETSIALGLLARSRSWLGARLTGSISSLRGEG